MSYEGLRGDFYSHLTLDISAYLQSIDGVCDLRIDERNACEGAVLLHWEQVHSVQFPEDVKAFYLSSNGFSFSWKFRLCDVNFPVGRMHINSLSELNPVTDAWKPDPNNMLDRDLCRLFTLDPNISQGSIVLLLTIGPANGSVHFLDSQGRLHKMADNFTSYMRLMMLYLGLPDWPLVHLGKEYNHWTQQLFSHFAAHLLEIKSNPLMDARIGRNFPNNTFDRNFFKVKATKQ